MLYDLTLPVHSGMPVYPGDPTVGSDGRRWSLGTHTGTHVDAPLHLLPGGRGAAELPLESLLGEAYLLDAAATVGLPELAMLPPGVLRLLVRGGAALTPSGADELVRRGILLFGTDATSCDPPDAIGLPAHHRLLKKGVVILEGLRLAGVPVGSCRLYCLPLRLHADGSPARVLLETDA